MVNLARLYLALRNERRHLNPFWRAPSLEQYALWIALTLRWPQHDCGGSNGAQMRQFGQRTIMVPA